MDHSDLKVLFSIACSLISIHMNLVTHYLEAWTDHTEIQVLCPSETLSREGRMAKMGSHWIQKPPSFPNARCYFLQWEQLTTSSCWLLLFSPSALVHTAQISQYTVRLNCGPKLLFDVWLAGGQSDEVFVWVGTDFRIWCSSQINSKHTGSGCWVLLTAITLSQFAVYHYTHGYL